MVDVAVVCVALLAALRPLVPVYGASAAWPATVGGVLIGAAVATVGAWRRWSAAGVAAVLVATYVLGGGLAAPTLTVLGVLPSPAGLRALAAAPVTAWKEMLTLEPPLGGGGALLAVPYLLGLLGAAAATGVALRARDPRRAGAAALVPAVWYPLGLLLGTRDEVRPVLTGVGLAAGLLVWASWRAGLLTVRRVGALALLGVLAVGAGAAGGPAVVADRDRFVLRDVIVPPFDPDDYPSPLSAFRAYVKADDQPLLTVTGLPAGARVRLATMDRYDGVVWAVSGDGSAAASGEFRRVGPAIAPTVQGRAAHVEIEVRARTGVWLPTVGAVTAMHLDPQAAARVRYNDATGTAVLLGGVTPGLRYALDVVVPDQSDDAQIGAAPAADVVLPPAVGVPDVVTTAAADVARDAGSPVQVARAIQQALSEQGYFSHGITTAGDYPSLSGHGADRITGLLGSDLMVGDAEQYASAMALMAREMGLPARVVLGVVAPSTAEQVSAVTTPGQPDGRTSGAAEVPGALDAPDPAGPTGPVTFTSGDIDAWVEIAFAGHGWVAFDPTPPPSRTPQQQQSVTPAKPDPQVVQPPPAEPDVVNPPDDDTEQPQTQDADRDAGSPWWHRALRVAGIAAVPLALLGAPLIVLAGLKARRRRRRRRHPDPTVRVAGGWQELVDAATDLGRTVGVNTTRREAARALAAAFGPPAAAGSSGTSRARRPAGPVGDLPAQLHELAADADAAVFGPAGVTPDAAGSYWERVVAATERMRRSSDRRRRLRSRASAASLRHRGAVRPNGSGARSWRRKEARP